MSENRKNQVTLVTGFSGAGMSSVLKVLEDMGHEVFDNFPLRLVDALLEEIDSSAQTAGQADYPPIAIGIDARTRGFESEMLIRKARDLNATLLFIACDDSELQRRFTETRRRHPLARGRPVRYGIEQEHKLLDSVRAAADHVIDTTALSVHDLRHMLEAYFDLSGRETLTVTLISFGFRHGLPREADIVMDVRFAKNPHWDEALKRLPGNDPKVGAFIQKDEYYARWLEDFKAMLVTLLPRYAAEGKQYLTIALGCTGGRHRSVYTAEQLYTWLQDLTLDTPITPYLEHRDLN